MKSIYKVLLFSVLSIGVLCAGNGLQQKHLQSVTPSSTEVTSKSNFVLTFDKPIREPSVKKRTVVLKQKKPQKQKLSTQVTVLNNTLTVSPASPLEKGIYVLKVKPIKLTQEGDNALQVKTPWQKFVAWLCGLFYQDISDCPMCKYFCYTSNVTKTKLIKFRFEIKEEMVQVKSLESNVTLVEMSEHNQTRISIIANYEDNTTEDVTQKASYTSSDSSVDVDKGIITSSAEGSATVTISYGGKATTLKVEVYEMIEGHLLPHEPDNPDATLLGVDKNDNGVRDEVERWIYKEMPTYHHPEIERVIAMTSAKAYQMTLKDPTNKDDKVLQAMEKAHNCWMYYEISRDLPMDGTIGNFSNKLKDEVFNTKERLKTYFDYDYTLRGRVFWSADWSKLDTSYCEDNIDVLP